MSYVAATMRIESRKPEIDAALEGLVCLNMAQMRNGKCPPLYRSGVRYRRDKGETWDSCRVVLKRGYGDCEDLAAYRAAELRTQGIPARAIVQRSHTPGVAWHCVVRYPDGRIEDPSRKLGM
jgi:hypothetical protein